jgi:hypothetical protein
MPTLVWKLLRQHISIGQLAGFFLANLFGMMIVLLSVQFYKDVIPVFTEGDSFMKKDFIIATKKISALGSFAGKSNTFSAEEIADLKKQPFTKTIGAFTPSQFKVSAGLGMKEAGIHLSTDMFFESVPDEFVDIKLDKWHFDENTHTIPIIIPRNYLNLYNFGFAQSRSLPKLSEGLMSLIQMDIMMRGNGRVEQYKGNIVGFSNRLNTILVPQSFMKWANENFAPNAEAQPARLIIEVSNPADSAIASYFQKKGYETEDGKLDAGKTTYFLRLIVGIVLGVGLFISILSFYILMLSIFLLLQKNTTKLESLLLIGYSPNKVALPYQLLTVGLNVIVLVLSIGLVSWLRSYYIDSIRILYPKEFKVIREGLTLMRQVEQKEAERNLAFCDSLIPVKQQELEGLKKGFNFEKDSAYNEIGNYVSKQQTIERNIQRCYIRSGVNEKGEMYLASVYFGGKPINHTGIKLSTQDGLFAETPAIPYDGGLNYHFKDLGNTTEVVTYQGEKCEDAVKFIFANKEKRIKVEYTGGKPYILYIADADKKAIASTYELAVVLSDIEKLTKEKEKATKKLAYLEKKLSGEK